MKIVHVISSIENEAAGPSYSVPRLARSLAEAGHSVTLMSLGSQAVTSAANGYCDQRFALDRGWPYPVSRVAAKLGVSSVMRKGLEASDGDVFHTHGLWMMPNVYPQSVAQAAGRPVVLSPRGMLGPEALQYSYWAKQLFWGLLQGHAARHATCLHATSEAEYNDIRIFGLRQPVAVIPNGIDVAPDDDEEPNGSGAPVEAGPGEPFVLSLGRIHPKKGLDRLIAAWAMVANDFPDWRLRIVGPDECGCARSLRAQIEGSGLSSASIEGPVYGREKDALMRRAEVFVLPSLNENFAMTVAESLAVATPVISTVGAPWRGLVINGCGWWVEHGPIPLATALREAMTLTPGQRAAMGARGRTWMQREYDWPTIAGQMSDVYRWLCTGGEAPGCVRS